MWMLFGLMGALMASTLVDSSMRGSTNAGDDDEGDERLPEDQWLDDWKDDDFISDDDDTPGDEEPGDEEPGDEEPGDDQPDDDPPGDDKSDDEERPPHDPWLDDWEDDEFISTDDDLPDDDEPDDERPGDDGPGDDGPGDDEPGNHDDQRPPADPWLDEWQDDEFISTDSVPAALTGNGGDQAPQIMAAGERLLAGGGAVYVLGDWIDSAEPAMIIGFEPDADRLVYAHLAEAGTPEISLAETAAAASGNGGTALLVNGQPVLLFDGGTAPSVDTVELFPVSLGVGAETRA